MIDSENSPSNYKTLKITFEQQWKILEKCIINALEFASCGYVLYIFFILAVVRDKP